MEVSNFELILKPQSPAPVIAGGPATPPTVAEFVIQAYFLELTNLESVELQYLLEFIIFPPPNVPGQEFRNLLGNTLCIVDSGGGDNRFGALQPAGVAGVFNPGFPIAGPFGSAFPNIRESLIKVPPKGTALIAVLPSAFGPQGVIDPTPLTETKFEVRGYVRIRLPALRQRGSVFKFPQFDRDVKVLLTPQNRATFFTSRNVITNQVQTSLPLANGKALNEVRAEQGFTIPLSRLEAEPGLIPGIDTLLSGASSQAQTELLASLLAQIDPERADFAGFNDFLAQQNVPFVIGRREAQ